jgi:serine/threonine-protein kinase
MGQVWAARLLGTRGFQKLVAIKTILPSEEDEQQRESMLRSEAALASSIKHPNVVEGLDLGEYGGTLYFVMEWVAGEPLAFVLKNAASKGGIPLPITAYIVASACKGLSAAHEARDDAGQLLGLVHRDISPQNLLISYGGAIKLADFGVAKATQRMAQASVIGQVKGKFAYMSPEQVRGAPIDGRSDIFAMGIVLYRMIAGRHPFKGETPGEMLARIVSGDPPLRPSTLVRGIEPDMDEVVMRALAHDPDERFENARQMQLALEQTVLSSETCNERDLRAFMHRLAGPRVAERARALREAVDVADARAAGSSHEPRCARVDSVSPDSAREAATGEEESSSNVPAAARDETPDATLSDLNLWLRRVRQDRRRKISRVIAAVVVAGAASLLTSVPPHRNSFPSAASSNEPIVAKPEALQSPTADPISWSIPPMATSTALAPPEQPMSVPVIQSGHPEPRRPIHPPAPVLPPHEARTAAHERSDAVRSPSQDDDDGDDPAVGTETTGVSPKEPDWDPLRARK